MKTFINLDNKLLSSLPEYFKNDDVRFPESLVEIFINEYSKPGDIIFDPFAGYGTTLIIAEKLNRIGFGIEYLEDRVEFIESKIFNKNNIIYGSSLELEKYDIPMIDLSITSPPYMSKNDHEQYPFAGYQITGDGYTQYLQDIKKVYNSIKRKLKPNAYVIVEISNIVNNEINTPLAWDVAKVISEVFTFEKEIVICWNKTDNNSDEYNYGFGYDHSYCLVFRNNM